MRPHLHVSNCYCRKCLLVVVTNKSCPFAQDHSRHCQLHERSMAGQYWEACVMEIEGILTLGQSNAGFLHGQPGGPILTDLNAQGQLLQLTGKAGGSVCDEEPDRFVPQLEPYTEPRGAGQTPAGMFGYASVMLDRLYKLPAQTLALHTAFRGDTPLERLFPNQPFHIHENAIGSQQAIADACAEMGYVYSLQWIDIIQGEGGPFENYGDLFERYLSEVVPLFQQFSGLGGQLRVLYSQINSFTHAVSCNEVSIEQSERASSFKRLGAFLAGPMYQYPFHDPGHLTDKARMMHGEVRALVRHHVNQTGNWTPLSPVTTHLEASGATLRIKMELPPGTDQLLLDRDWIPPAPDEGFTVKSASGEQLSISNVSIDRETIVITLHQPLTTSYCLVDYATYNSPGIEWWASGRGHVYADSNVPSPYHELGFNIPATIRHYCVAFSLTIPVNLGE